MTLSVKNSIISSIDFIVSNGDIVNSDAVFNRSVVLGKWIISKSRIEEMIDSDSFLIPTIKTATLLKKPISVETTYILLPDRMSGAFDVIRSNAKRVPGDFKTRTPIDIDDGLQAALVRIKQIQGKFNDINLLKLENSLKKQSKKNMKNAYNQDEIESFIRRVQATEPNRRITFGKKKVDKVQHLLEYLSNIIKEEGLKDSSKRESKLTVVDDDDEDLVDDPYGYTSRKSNASNVDSDIDSEEERIAKRSKSKTSKTKTSKSKTKKKDTSSDSSDIDSDSDN